MRKSKDNLVYALCDSEFYTYKLEEERDKLVDRVIDLEMEVAILRKAFDLSCMPLELYYEQAKKEILHGELHKGTD